MNVRKKSVLLGVVLLAISVLILHDVGSPFGVADLVPDSQTNITQLRSDVRGSGRKLLIGARRSQRHISKKVPVLSWDDPVIAKVFNELIRSEVDRAKFIRSTNDGVFGEGGLVFQISPMSVQEKERLRKLINDIDGVKADLFGATVSWSAFLRGWFVLDFADTELEAGIYYHQDGQKVLSMITSLDPLTGKKRFHNFPSYEIEDAYRQPGLPWRFEHIAHFSQEIDYPEISQDNEE